MPSNNTKAPIRWSKRRIVLAAVGAIIVVLLAAAWFVYDDASNGPEYRAAVSRCGVDQLVVGEAIPKTNHNLYYLLPGQMNYYNSPFPGGAYFCSEKEAQQAGYYPGIDKDGNYSL